MIDTYFKQYFWSFHLLLIAGSAFLVARTINTFVGDALRPRPDAIAAAAGDDPTQQARPTGANSAPISAFLDRNIFHAAREDLTAEAEAASKQEAGAFDENNCEKSSLPAGLIATIVASTEIDSIAVFNDNNKKEAITYRLGEKVVDEAELVSIEWRRVLVKHNGRCEFLSLEDEGEGTKVVTAQAPVTPPEGGDAAPVEGELGKNIKKVSESEYEIPRQEIDGVLSNLNTVATQARIVPSFHDGKANGFKLFSIRPGSLYSKIGIQNGDIVQRINGYEINSPDRALEVYSKLKDAQAITVDLVRRGKSQTLSYSIR